MVRVKRGKAGNSITKTFLTWLEESGTGEEETLLVLKESQRALMQAISSTVGEAKSLTYRFEEGWLVRLFPEGEDQFSLQFLDEDGGQSDSTVTKLYELYFPDLSETESEVQYHGRLLEGLDHFVDGLATGELVELSK